MHAPLLDGCTAVLVLLLGRQVFVAGVGDSAAYLARRSPNGRYGQSKLLTSKIRVATMEGFAFLVSTATYFFDILNGHGRCVALRTSNALASTSWMANKICVVLRECCYQ